MIQPNPGWRGDPTFLPEVLKAFGVTVKEFPGWRDRGHGDFGRIQGVFCHHIGSNSCPPSYIAQHPQLGLCSQIHLSRSGVATLCGVGIAWHAGRGWGHGYPANDANRLAIGIEPEGDGISAWPAEQLDAYYRCVAAILWFLGKRATPETCTSHWEYSYQAQGKWDPGAGNGRSGALMDMNVFRREVNKYIDNPPFSKETELSFDKIETRYRSRVNGSNIEMRPIDALLNADAHAFVARANTEDIKDLIVKGFDAINARLTALEAK